MRPAATLPPLAQAADLLGAEFHRSARRLARILNGRAGPIDTAFLSWLRRRFDAKQSKALASITFGAAARMLAQKRSLAGFFEQVEYGGRRLAKLDVAPDAVLESLAVYGRLLARSVRTLPALDSAELRWVAEQLDFCVVLTLNNAFYEVREAETQAFFELHDAELKEDTEAGLLAAYLEVLRRFCRAEAACAVFDRGHRQVLASGVPPPAAGSVDFRRLAGPMLLRTTNGQGRRLLDASWRGRYVSVWSIPLGQAGAMQFAFRKEYEWLPRELRLLTGAAARCVTASEKLRLAAQLAAREQEVRQLAARMSEVEERERRRISRELHDEAAQLLPCVRLQLEMLEREAAGALPAVAKGLSEARELIGRTVVEIRRVLSDLSPAVLEQLGLAAAVRQLLLRLQESHRISVRLDIARLGPLPDKTETIVYRLVQECCNNAARHSSASHLNVFLATADGWLKMRIEDDGIGFRVEEALAKPGSHGLAGMRERVALAGGEIKVKSAPGRGTRIVASIPFPEEAARSKGAKSQTAPRCA